LTFNGTITLTNGMTYLGIGGTNGSGNITFNGPIVGNKGIVIGTNSFDLNGSAMVGTKAVFNGSNSYTGTTTILRGNLAITNGNSLSTNRVIIGLGGVTGLIDAGLTVNGTTTASNTFVFANTGTNAALNVTNNAAFTIAGNLVNDAGANLATKFGKSGAGTLILAGAASTYSGQVQIGDGALVIGNSSAFGTNITTATRGIDLGLNLRDVNQTNNVSLLLSNGVVLSNSIYVSQNTNGATRTVGVLGSGTATISNQMYLDGTFIANAGTGNTLAIVGNLTNTGGISKIGAGTLVLGASNNNTGLLDISNGVVLVSNGRGIAQASTGTTVRSGAALEFTNGITLASTNITINGTPTPFGGTFRGTRL
jgi:autotransporter-associated beta strand protein